MLWAVVAYRRPEASLHRLHKLERPHPGYIRVRLLLSSVSWTEWSGRCMNGQDGAYYRYRDLKRTSAHSACTITPKL
jgi:hypothetical protein